MVHNSAVPSQDSFWCLLIISFWCLTCSIFNFRNAYFHFWIQFLYSDIDISYSRNLMDKILFFLIQQILIYISKYLLAITWSLPILVLFILGDFSPEHGSHFFFLFILLFFIIWWTFRCCITESLGFIRVLSFVLADSQFTCIFFGLSHLPYLY